MIKKNKKEEFRGKNDGKEKNEEKRGEMIKKEEKRRMSSTSVSFFIIHPYDRKKIREEFQNFKGGKDFSGGHNI